MLQQDGFSHDGPYSARAHEFGNGGHQVDGIQLRCIRLVTLSGFGALRKDTEGKPLIERSKMAQSESDNCPYSKFPQA